MHGIVDGDLLVYRIGYSSEDVNERLALFRLRDYFQSILEKLLLTSHNTYITSGDKSNYRYALDSSYKANRKQPKPKHYDFLRESLENNNIFNTEVVFNMEADDAIGIKASSFKSKKDYCIITLDKDLIQIPGWHYNFVKEKKFYVPEATSKRWFYKQLLLGDSADNIEGIIGIGEQLANNLIDVCNTEEEMYCVVHHIYEQTNNLQHLRTRGQLLKILQKEKESLWEPPVLSGTLINETAKNIIKVDWRKSFEKFSKIREKRLSMSQSECTSNTQALSDSTNQTG